MEVPFRIVDVFTDRPLAGNQLCVVPEPVDGLDRKVMQAIAGEIGFSETTFVTEAEADRYAMRIFTPAEELPFAGHPTLGTAFLLAAEGRIGARATQVVQAGEFLVQTDVEAGSARVRQLAPQFRTEAKALAPLAHAVGVAERDLRTDLWPRVVSTGLAHLLVAARDAEAVALARPIAAEIETVLEEVDATGLYLFAILGDGEAKARMFPPGVGIAEDPATGSAAGPLGAYLAQQREAGMPGRLRILQGEEIGRPSELFADVTEDGDSFEVWVQGSVRIVGRGVFQL